MKLDQKTKMV